MLLCSMIVTACDNGGSGTPCDRDEDCPSHFCKADGTCGAAETDGGVDGADADAPAGVCTPNHDGMITLGELPLMAGKMATFRVASNPTFDTAGTAAGAGMRRWDLAIALGNDADKPLALLSPTAQWCVFHTEAAQVTLLGVVSPAAGTFRTELAYDPPVKILALPISAAATWTSTSSVSGVAQGVIAAYSEKYTSLVDQVGTMKTPYGEFPVVRIATDLTRTSGFTTLLTKRQFAWTAECYGSVATVASQDFETSAEFTDPAEVKRLAP
jgi:hypothetical protein